MSYLLNEKLTSTLIVYMILKRVMRKWEDWEAAKLGLISPKDGRRLRRAKTAKERESYDILDRFCWSIKRLCTKYLGDSNFAYLFSAAYLMKEKCVPTFNANLEKYRPELEEMTYTKQKVLHDCFREIESKQVMIESQLDLETNILKNLQIIKKIIDKYIVEEDVVGTSLGDVAQFTPRIGNISKEKIQRRLKRRKQSKEKYHG